MIAPAIERANANKLGDIRGRAPKKYSITAIAPALARQMQALQALRRESKNFRGCLGAAGRRGLLRVVAALEYDHQHRRRRIA